MSGRYVSRSGHRTGESSSSFQPKNSGPLENGSAFHVRGSPAWSSPCLRQLLSTYLVNLHADLD